MSVKRGVIVEFANEELYEAWAEAATLPPDVRIAHTQYSFDRNSFSVRFEGPGLPGWCETPEGMPYPRASVSDPSSEVPFQLV